MKVVSYRKIPNSSLVEECIKSAPQVKMELSNKCKKCGGCCDPIRLSKRITPDLIPDSAPKGWLQRHWHLIKKEGKTYLYSCDLYDKKTHLCTIHKGKPKVCREYPYVREHPDDFEKFTLKGCGYRCESRR